jgi:hypothetical protein
MTLLLTESHRQWLDTRQSSFVLDLSETALSYPPKKEYK